MNTPTQKRRNSLKWFIFSAAICAISTLACGFDDESSSSESFRCCLNGAFYDCDSSEELATCSLTSDEPIQCSRDSSRDDEC